MNSDPMFESMYLRLYMSLLRKYKQQVYMQWYDPFPTLEFDLHITLRLFLKEVLLDYAHPTTNETKSWQQAFEDVDKRGWIPELKIILKQRLRCGDTTEEALEYIQSTPVEHILNLFSPSKERRRRLAMLQVTGQHSPYLLGLSGEAIIRASSSDSDLKECALMDCNNRAFRRSEYCFSHRHLRGIRDAVRNSHIYSNVNESIVSGAVLEIYPVMPNVFIDILRNKSAAFDEKSGTDGENQVFPTGRTVEVTAKILRGDTKRGGEDHEDYGEERRQIGFQEELDIVECADDFEWLATIPVQKYVSFLNYCNASGHSTHFHCTTFCVLQPQSVRTEDLERGEYNQHPASPRSAVQVFVGLFRLKSFNVHVLKTFEKVEIYPHFMDVGGSPFELHFSSNDAPVEAVLFKGTYRPDTATGSPASLSFVTNTNTCGRIAMSLPPGELSGFVVPPSGSKPISIFYAVPDRCDVLNANLLGREQLSREHLGRDLLGREQLIREHLGRDLLGREQEDDVGRSRKLPPITPIIYAIQDSDIIVSIRPDHDVRRKVAVLGDISGSMQLGDRMKYLKTSLLNLYTSSLALDIPIALIAWNNTITVCLDKYVDQGDQEEVEKWIQQLQPDYSTNLRQAIEQTLHQFPDVGDIHIICDGDVTPFEPHGFGACVSLLDPPYSVDDVDEYSWTSFCSIYPHVRFHFIAVGDDADYKTMCALSTEGRGDFTMANITPTTVDNSSYRAGASAARSSHKARTVNSGPTVKGSLRGARSTSRAPHTTRSSLGGMVNKIWNYVRKPWHH